MHAHTHTHARTHSHTHTHTLCFMGIGLLLTFSFYFQDGSVESSSDYGHVRDVYAFGVLAESMLEKLNDLGMSKLFLYI